jgi:hypothetical protein
VLGKSNLKLAQASTIKRGRTQIRCSFRVLFFGIDDEVIVDPDLADSLTTTA